MFIQTNDNNEIIQIIFVGEKPLVNGYEIDDIDKTIFKKIYLIINI